MKLAIAMVFLLVAQSGGEPPQSKEKDIVETAKESKAKRKASKTKVIKNADVKKSKGKLIVLSTPAESPAETKPAAQVLEPDERYRARLDAKERIATAEKKVSELEKSVQDLEQQYYETNDPNYRDQVIQSRFTQAKRQLDEARQQLADERDALKRIDELKP